MNNIGLSDETLRHLLAATAPVPSSEAVKLHAQRNRQMNPHNDSYKPPILSYEEISCALRYEYADMMLAASKGKFKL